MSCAEKRFCEKKAVSSCCRVVLFLSILQFLTPHRIFKYLRSRHSRDQVDHLNTTLKTRVKLNTLAANGRFLKDCLKNGVSPVDIQRRAVRTRVHDRLKLERILVKDELVRTQQQYASLKVKWSRLYSFCHGFLSFFDFVRFSSLLSSTDQSQRSSLSLKYAKSIQRLRQHKCGAASFNHDFIINMSSITLSELEKDVLSKGTDFCLPSRVRKEESLSEFELFYEQLSKLESKSEESMVQCRDELQYLSTKVSSSKPDMSSFSLSKQHLQSLNDLRHNTNIVISRPDKGRATVVMDKVDYVTKMMLLLSDETKFLRLGPVTEYDRTIKIETEICHHLKRVMELNEISENEFNILKPIGSSRPRMYGLPKIHKAGCPLRPILSMSGSPQYSVSRWLCSLLQPVVSLYGTRCVRDSFHFLDELNDASVPPNGFLCSFDVVSLFTNVPLVETIDICCDVLYHMCDIRPPSLSEKSFRRLMLMVTSGVEFSFDGVMFRQIDGVAMGSPLGPVLANIFVGFCESRISDVEYPPLYCRFVDDCWAYFADEDCALEFKRKLDNLHPSLKFTCEFEQNASLPFLDVLVERVVDGGFITSVYRKPTFTGMCLQFDSFCPVKYKIGLIRCLVNRALRICSVEKLSGELDFLRNMFLKNGYPVGIVNKHLTTDLTVGRNLDRDGDNRCILRLPYVGANNLDIERRVRSLTCE